MTGKGKYPAQVNFQMTYADRDIIDAIGELTGASRAEIIRDCIAASLAHVRSQRKLTNGKVAAQARVIASMREGNDE